MSKNLNILIIPAWFDACNVQVGSFFHEYAQAMSRDHSVCLLDVKYYSKGQKIEKRSKSLGFISRYNYQSYYYKSRLPMRFARLFLKAHKSTILKDVLSFVQDIENAQGKFDVIHMQSMCNNLTPIVGAFLSEKLNLPLVVREHYSSFHIVKDELFMPFTNLDEIKQITQSASARFAVSRSAANAFEDFFEVDYKVCHNLVPDSFIPVDPLINKEPSSTFQFLCVGRFYENKGQLRIVKAFENAIKVNNKLRLVLIGDGAQKIEVENYIEAKGLSDNIQLTGSVSRENMVPYYDKTNVLISASQIETFGLTLVEAMFRGVPCIATKSGGPDEIVDDSNGLLIEVGNHQALVDAMLQMSVNYEKYDHDAISNNAISKYSEKRIIEQMTRSYQAVIADFNS